MQNLTATQIKLLNTLNNGSLTFAEVKALGFDAIEACHLDCDEFVTLKGGVFTIAQKGLQVIARVKLLNTLNNNGTLTLAQVNALGFDPIDACYLDCDEFATLKGGVLTITQKGLQVIA